MTPKEHRLLVQKLEMEMSSANAAANRYMREATAHLTDQHLWDLWQQAEEIAVRARKRWHAARTPDEPVTNRAAERKHIVTPLLTIPEVADILKISPRTAWKKVKAGIIPAFLFGTDWRIHPVIFEEWLAKQAGLSTDEQPRRGRKKTNYAVQLKQHYPDVFTDGVH